MKFPMSNIKSPMLMLLIVAALVVSCRPRGILHSWEMRDVLVDLHKTDAMLQLNGVRYNEESKRIYYAQVLEKHDITQAQFDSSLVWYTAHPKLFDKIYPKVIAKLEAEEAEFLALHKAELMLKPEDTKESTTAEQQHVFHRADLDSILWVNRNSYPSTWNPVPYGYYGPLTH